MTRACTKLRIENLHFHNLRYEGTSRLFEQGYNIPEVASVTLHESWNGLKRYTQLRPESLHRETTVPGFAGLRGCLTVRTASRLLAKLHLSVYTDGNMSEGLTTATIAAAASLIGALIGAGIPALLTAKIASRQRRDDKAHLAVTVSAALESYLVGCINVMFDSGELDMETEQYIQRVSSPVLELKSLDINWRSIPVALLDRIFAIPNAQQSINDKISWEAEHMEFPILLRQIEYGTLAKKALSVLVAYEEKRRCLQSSRDDWTMQI